MRRWLLVAALGGRPAKPVDLDVALGLGSLPGLVVPRLDPIEPAGQEIVVKLAEGVRYACVATLPDGTPASRAHVLTIGARETCLTDEGGRFVFWLAPGVHDGVQDRGPLARGGRRPRLGQAGARRSELVRGTATPADEAIARSGPGGRARRTRAVLS